MTSNKPARRKVRLADVPDGSTDVRTLLIRHLDDALASIRSSGSPSGTQVHATRRSLKRARALLVLLRSSLTSGDYVFCKTKLRDAGRALAEARDAAVMAETLDSMARRASKARPSEARLIRKTQLKRAKISVPLPLHHEMDARSTYELTAAVHDRLLRSRVPASGWSTIGPGLSKTYRRGRQQYRQLVKSRATDSLHDWRKQVKKYLHMLEALQPTNPERLDAEIRELRRLAKALGKDHDIALLQAKVAEEAKGKKVSLRLKSEMARRRAELQARALQIGRKVYVAPAKVIEGRSRRDWRAWHTRTNAKSSRPH